MVSNPLAPPPKLARLLSIRCRNARCINDDPLVLILFSMDFMDSLALLLMYLWHFKPYQFKRKGYTSASTLPPNGD